MFSTHPLVARILFGTLLVVVVGYGFLRAYDFVYGPRLHLDTAADELRVRHAFTTIAGSVENVVSLSVNGQELLLDESGAFRHSLLLAPGANYLTFTAQDKFGKTTQKTIRIIYKPKPPDKRSSAASLDQ